MLNKLSPDMKEFIELLQKHQVEFLVCGGHAVAFHGYPRMTMDFDLLIKPTEVNAQRIICCLNEFGFGHIPELKASKFCQAGTVFTLGVQPNQIDLLTSVSTQNETEIFDHCIKGTLEGISLDFISLDDLLRAKREANRLKDQLDIEELTKLNKSN